MAMALVDSLKLCLNSLIGR